MNTVQITWHVFQTEAVNSTLIIVTVYLYSLQKWDVSRIQQLPTLEILLWLLWKQRCVTEE